MRHILMCKPLFFQVEYQINPWMKIGSVNEKKAMDQWESLVSIYKGLGIKVFVIDQQKGLPDMVFSADQGIIHNKKILLSNFKYPERKNEIRIYEKWFKDYGLHILRLPPDVYFEGGGETIRWKNVLFSGTGFRTSIQALHLIQEALGLKVIGLELVDKRFYHLDTCFFILDEQTAFYYPPAFTPQSISLIKRHIPHAIELEEVDVLRFATNSVVIDKSVIMPSNNERFAQSIRNLGYTPIMTDVSEFIKAGGGIHCLTGDLYSSQPLDRIE